MPDHSNAPRAPRASRALVSIAALALLGGGAWALEASASSTSVEVDATEADAHGVVTEPASAAGGDAPARAEPTADPVAAGWPADEGLPEHVVVSEGDTAIGLLAPLAPEGVPAREFVREVLEANDARAEALQPGEVLVLEP